IINNLREIATTSTDASRGKSLKARVRYQQRLEANRIKAPFVNIRQPDISLPAYKCENNNTADNTDNNSINNTEVTVTLKVEDYSLAFDDVLLEKAGFELKATDKAALIGSNGTGKTSLLRDIFNNRHNAIMLGENTRMAYLSQLQGEMLDDSNSISAEFFGAGFKTFDDIKECISKYGFNEDSLDQKIGTLSGGEKNLLQLAKLSGSEATLLLLDEPTSHLDTYSQIALEKAINNYRGSVLMISHDFHTIANCMDFVLMIEDKQIRKMSIRKFRKMIYADHFDKDYLELEHRKKQFETKIEQALKDTDFERAKKVSEGLEELIGSF
ncbi:MAG: ABC-F family ATP-binding cassette domain-containing protein, partial [Clostridiales bacterium]|nr:ABC-F family ATP-binding cassette domain-containing protein [Clostridiales bacterium]